MTNRREFLTRLTMAAGAVTVLKPLSAFADFGIHRPSLLQSDKLILLHTANLKGQLTKLNGAEKFSGLGGIKNLSGIIDSIRKERAAVLLMDAGNMGSNRGGKNIDEMEFYHEIRRMGFDVTMPGQTDLAKRSMYFDELAKQSRVEVLTNKGTSVLTHHILTKGNIKIGIIAVKAPSLKKLSLSLISAINHTAANLKETHNCRLVISIVQGSLFQCRQLAPLTQQIDVIATSVENHTIHNTTVLQNKNGHEVIMSAAGVKGAMMSRIDITFNDDHQKINVASKAIFAGSEDVGYAGILKRCAVCNA